MKLLISLAVFSALLGTAFSQTYPDAPSQRHCYTNADSKGTMIEIPCDTVPKLSNVRDWAPIVILPPQHTSFFAGRRWTDPPLRTNSEILHSKSFRLLTLGLAGSCAANLIRNWDGAHKRNQPHGGELLLDDLLPMGVNLAGTFAAYKYIWAPIGVGTAGYGIFINTRSAIDGNYF